ncbi:hypothetical protein WMO66_09750 [Faecousia sp. CLA-AA-H192]|uniref:Uncharacterized protein n=1 Tax=Faecousia intestinalis TaxID=3133167 RepID=A0ABV1G858_9FIRM
MRKGIFWCANFDTECPELITVSAACDKNGDSKELVRFSSKSGNNFNHRPEWERLDRSITAGRPFNYYPRGRVEIKNGKATVFLNPAINKECIVYRIMDAFELMTGELNCINIKSDGSSHYRFTCESAERES